MLHYAGEAVNDILNTSDDTEAEEGQDPLEKNDDSDHDSSNLKCRQIVGKCKKSPGLK